MYVSIDLVEEVIERQLKEIQNQAGDKAAECIRCI